MFHLIFNLKHAFIHPFNHIITSLLFKNFILFNYLSTNHLMTSLYAFIIVIFVEFNHYNHHFKFQFNILMDILIKILQLIRILKFIMFIQLIEI